MNNAEILRNLDRCLRALNNIIVRGYDDEWDGDTLDEMECIIDSLTFNYKEMKKNSEE